MVCYAPLFFVVCCSDCILHCSAVNLQTTPGKYRKKKLGVSCSYVFVQNNDLKPVFIAMPHNLLCARSESEDGLAQCFSNQHTTWIAKGYHQHGTQFTHDLMYGGALT